MSVISFSPLLHIFVNVTHVYCENEMGSLMNRVG